MVEKAVTGRNALPMTISFFIYDTVRFDIRNCRYDTRKKDRYSHGRNRAVALRKRARDLIKVIGQGSKPALVPNRAQARDITI